MTDTGSMRQARFWQRRLPGVAALAGAALLAGCQVIPKAERPLPPPPETKAEDISALPTDATRHRIALLVPMTGANAGVGKSIANATTMALLDTKTERLRITTYDTGTDPAGAAQKAIAEGNRLIIGPLTADEVRAVAPAARTASVPLISLSNDVSVAGKGVFLMGYVPAQSVDRVVRFASSAATRTLPRWCPRASMASARAALS